VDINIKLVGLYQVTVD